MASYHRVTCLDKLGRPFALGQCPKKQLDSVLKMYDAYDPIPASQGLPPEDSKTRACWVDNLMRQGTCYAIWEGDSIVAHAVLLIEEIKNDGEFLIFVSRGYRNRGLGTLVTKAAISHAKELKLNRLWLEVETFNFPAIHLYQKMGFKFCGGFTCERQMTLEIGPKNDLETGDNAG